MKFIKQSSIDTVLEDVKIYDIVNDTEELKKKGANWFCLSPFVQEKSPSFCVNPVKNNFFDYASGFGGNAITFLRKKYPGMSFFEAIEKAAAISNITLDYEEMSEDAKRLFDEEQAMKALMELSTEQYQKEYHKLPAEAWPREMMELKRRYSEETLQSFMIGFAPNIRSFIADQAINMGRFEIAKSLGLLNVKDSSSYDFFRDRIMFPIHNDRGQVVGFGGRRNNGEEYEKYAKYLNSKESKIYFKEKVLYGYWQAKKRIAELDKAIIIEGYTDVMSMHQAGVVHSVAPCGTALTPGHVKLISRLTKNVTLFWDGDRAGISAANRALDTLLKDGMSVSIVIAPEGEDPDSLARQCDIGEFIERNSEDAVMWKAKELAKTTVNPELIKFEEQLKKELDKEIEEMKKSIHPPAAFDGLNKMDKKFLEKENEAIFKKIQEAERDMKASLADFPKNDPNAVARAVDQMAFTLSMIPNKIKRDSYVKIVAKILNQKAISITQIIQAREEEEEKNRETRSKASEEKENALLGLPKGADPEQYLADRFCEIDNRYHFHNGSSFFVGTNFRMVPLFHVEGKADNKRLCEVINDKGHKRLIDFDSTDLINFTKIKERLIQEGFFFWEPGTSVSHFQLVAKKLLNEFITATELKVLGHQQREGFFAFADGVFHQHDFKPVNKYGIVHVEGLEKLDNEYRSDIQHFYSPSHSEIYKSAREDDDPYENDRYFVYKRAKISIDQWMEQMVKVWGDKGKFGVMFCLAANFRDLFLQHWKYFPLLGGFGQKDSGKSGFGVCIQSFFFYNLPALELNTSTLVAMARRLTRCKNVVNFFDEYRDDIDEEKKQMIKGVWNSIGREKGKGVDNNRTSTDKINSGLYFSGQYIPATDDGAIPSRTISLNFEQKEYTSQEKEEYGKLVGWANEGISSFILDVIKHRKEVQKNITATYVEVGKELKAALHGVDYQNRIFENYMVPLVILKILQDKFNFPFTYEEYFNLTKDGIIENSDTISDVDGLARFWRIVQYLADLEIKTLKEGHDYQIEKVAKCTIVQNKKEKIEWVNRDHDEILFLNFSKVHQAYHKEASTRKGEDVITETVIRNYLKTKKYFIGLFPSRRMGQQTPSGYAFNYTMMKRLGIVNLPAGNDSQTEMDLHKGPKKHTIITNPNQTAAL